MKKKSNLTFLFIAMGPGEVTQGLALAEYVLQRHHKAIFVVRLKENFLFLRDYDPRLTILLVENSDQLKKIFEEEKPNILVLCNSKIISYYKEVLCANPDSRL